MIDSFKPGDVVMLKSGGVPMTISKVGFDRTSVGGHPVPDSVWCHWHDREGRHDQGEFHPDLLIRYSSDALARLYRDIGL